VLKSSPVEVILGQVGRERLREELVGRQGLLIEAHRHLRSKL
jgi:hypothetical protein